MAFEGIITAMVTPFDSSGSLDEDASARLIRHLLDAGSDGLVLGGTTGEGPTLDDEEKVRLWKIAREVAGGAPLIAGTGSNDTRHTVELTERAAATGMDGALVVTPYYNKPNRSGVHAHFEAVAQATELPIVVYNIPSRAVVDIPNDQLRELAEIETVVAVKQSREQDCAPVEGLDLLAGNDEMLAPVLDMGGTGGILVASHLVGREMRRMIDEPDARAKIDAGLQALLAALAVTVNPIPVKTALEMLGHDVGPLRLPMVAASEQERATIRSALEAYGLLERV